MHGISSLAVNHKSKNTYIINCNDQPLNTNRQSKRIGDKTLLVTPSDAVLVWLLKTLL